MRTQVLRITGKAKKVWEVLKQLVEYYGSDTRIIDMEDRDAR